MVFWSFMLLCDLLIPAVMIVAGWMMWKRCPQKINRIYGYRTERSMKNADTWRFAHDLCGRLWWKIGWVVLIPSAVLHLLLIRSSEGDIALASMLLCVVQVVVLIASAIPVEAALKRTFHPDGTRK